MSGPSAGITTLSVAILVKLSKLSKGKLCTTLMGCMVISMPNDISVYPSEVDEDDQNLSTFPCGRQDPTMKRWSLDLPKTIDAFDVTT